MPCAVCSHACRVSIERRILSGEPLKAILVDFPIELFYHKSVCMEGKDWADFQYAEDPYPEDNGPSLTRDRASYGREKDLDDLALGDYDLSPYVFLNGERI